MSNHRTTKDPSREAAGLSFCPPELDTEEYQSPAERTAHFFNRIGAPVFPATFQTKGTYIKRWPYAYLDTAATITTKALTKGKPIKSTACQRSWGRASRGAARRDP